MSYIGVVLMSKLLRSGTGRLLRTPSGSLARASICSECGAVETPQQFLATITGWTPCAGVTGTCNGTYLLDRSGPCTWTKLNAYTLSSTPGCTGITMTNQPFQVVLSLNNPGFITLETYISVGVGKRPFFLSLPTFGVSPCSGTWSGGNSNGAVCCAAGINAGHFGRNGTCTVSAV